MTSECTLREVSTLLWHVSLCLHGMIGWDYFLSIVTSYIAINHPSIVGDISTMEQDSYCINLLYRSQSFTSHSNDIKVQKQLSTLLKLCLYLSIGISARVVTTRFNHICAQLLPGLEKHIFQQNWRGGGGTPNIGRTKRMFLLFWGVRKLLDSTNFKPFAKFALIFVVWNERIFNNWEC